MKKLKEYWLTLPETVTVTRLDGILIVIISALIGVIIGMLFSPKKYISIGCNKKVHNEGISDEYIEETDIRDDDEDIEIK